MNCLTSSDITVELKSEYSYTKDYQLKPTKNDWEICTFFGIIFIVNSISMRCFIFVMIFTLIPQNAFAACSGIITNTPVRTLYSGLSKHFVRGDKVRLSRMKRVNGNLFYCIWSGPCIYSDDLKLYRQLAVKGDLSAMNGREIRQNTYETLAPCAIQSLQ